MIDTKKKGLVSPEAESVQEQEDDPVVEEFEVCLSGDLKDQLMLLQYPLRPRYRQYGDQGDFFKAELAIHSKNKEDKTKGTKKIEEEPANLKLHYQLKPGVNYNQNADDHRIKTQTLLSTPVDTCGQAVDSTFATVDLKVQANYAIGVFQDGKFVLTPLQKFH